MNDPRDDALEEQFFPMPSAIWRRHLPWLRLFDAFRLAIDYRKILLALLAVMLWSAGEWLLSWLPHSPPTVVSRTGGPGDLPRDLSFDGTAGVDESADVRTFWPWEARALPPAPATRTRIELGNAVAAPWATLQRALANGRVVLWPLERMTGAARRLIAPGVGWSAWIHSWLTVLWALAVSALFGALISRMSAADATQRGHGTVQRSGEFTVPRVGTSVLAPLSTVVGVGLIWGANAMAGLFARVPVLGDGFVSLFWFLPVIAGVFLALVVVGVAAGWPLMIAAVSIDDTDPFESLSRSYGYLFNRPWYALFLLLLVLLYGSVLLYFVTGILTLAVDLSAGSIETGLGETKSRQFLSRAPDHPMFQAGPVLLDEPRLSGSNVSRISQEVVGFWMRLLGSLPTAFVFSYFWVSTTLIYILLRHREDAIPLDEFVRPDERKDPPALSGIAAMNHR